MKLTKTIARKLVFPIAMRIGIDKLLRNQAKNSILHIMYHGVVTTDSSYFSPRHITEKQFEEHLKYYKENFEIISVNESFKKVLKGEKLNKKYITISFDDGFKNNLTTALPLLKKYNIPTTFFISSICVKENEDNYLWSELISALKYFYKNESIEINNMTFTNLYCKEENIELTDFIKSLPYDKRDDVLKFLEKKYNLKTKIESLPEEVWKLLNKEELIELSKSSLVTIGSHSHRHFNLAEIDPQAAKKELHISKELLNKTLGSDINLIAYPDGSYNETVKNIAEEIGYNGQLAVKYKSSKDYTDPRIMNRHGISSTTTFDSNMLVLNMAFKKKGIN